MKLIYRIIIRIALMLTVVLGAWAVFFYIITHFLFYNHIEKRGRVYSSASLTR